MYRLRTVKIVEPFRKQIGPDLHQEDLVVDDLSSSARLTAELYRVIFSFLLLLLLLLFLLLLGCFFFLFMIVL